MHPLQSSLRGQNVIASPIRKFLPLMRETLAKGIKVYSLNTGDPDLTPPQAFFDAVHTYPAAHLNYAPSPGIKEHTDAWIEYYRTFGVHLTSQNIIPTVGCAEAILLSLMAVADPGDEIIVFEPLYVSYKSFAVMTGIKLVPITLKNEENFALPAPELIESKITKKTRAIVVINPDNPTGKLWSSQELNMIVDIVKKHKLFLISDETYREIRFHGEPECLLSRVDAKEHIILTDSVSKRYSMPGARIGCIASYNNAIMSAVLKFAQARLSAGTLEQIGLIPLLKNSKIYTDPVRDEYRHRRDIVYAALSGIPGVTCSKPEGAFYVYASLPVDSAENFVKFLISDFQDSGETVMLTPMADFYITPNLGINEIRIAYVLNASALQRAMNILKAALAAYPGKTTNNTTR